jgi:phosphatidylglycerophosphate synthase
MGNNQFAALVHVPHYNQTKILGLTTIERSVLALSKAGVIDIVIQTDDIDTISLHLSNLVKQVQLHILKNTDSISAAEKLKKINPELIFVFNEPIAVDVAVLEELKKTSGGISNVRTSGKEIVLYNFKDYIEKGEDLNFNIVAIGNRTCHSFSNRQELQKLESKLINNLVKPSDGWVSRILNRPISTRISKVLARYPITPNQVTLINGIFGFSACYFIYQGGYANWLIGGLIIHLASIIDGVDGEIARLKFQHSKFGQSLDTFFDYSSALVALICLTLSVRNEGWPDFYYNAGIAAGVSAMLAIIVLTIYVSRRGIDGTFNNIGYAHKAKDNNYAKVVYFFGFLTKREMYNLIIFLFGIFGVMPWTLVFVAIMTFSVTIFAIHANLILHKKFDT